MKTDIQIARECQLAPIGEIASQLGIDPEKIEPYGRYMAKVPISLIDEKRVKQSRLILVTAISPTKAGIGKTTVSIGGGGTERTLAGSLFRNERRCGWRRLCPGVADGED